MSEESRNSASFKSVMSKRERIFLSISDFLMLGMILIDLLYWGELLKIKSSYLLYSNVVVVAISYVAYELKKRIKRKNLRRIKKETD